METISKNGRIVSVRTHKKTVFLNLDDSNSTSQLLVNRDYFDSSPLVIGDFISAVGENGYSRSSEPSLITREYSLLNRPVSYLGEEENFAQLLRSRSELANIVRTTLLERGLVEVSSNILGESQGCSNVIPFRTADVNDAAFYLRFTMDLELKKLVAKTQLPVFEIGKVFRNMGYDARHYREYSIVETCMPYKKLEDGIEIVEDIFRKACTHFGTKVDVIPRTNVHDACRQVCCEGDISLKELYQKKVKTQYGPFFTLFPPKEWSPLSISRADGTAMDSELIYHGLGVAHICEEETDYDKLKSTFENQLQELSKTRAGVGIDTSFLESVKHGLPPSTGFCMGLDRLLMVLLNETNVRRVIPFSNRT